jgi:predicted aspartyl protease
LPLERTDAPGIYRRGSRYVVVYRVEGRQRKQYATTLAEGRAIKIKRDRRGHCAAARRCTGSAFRGLIATPAPGTTACAPTRAASTVAYWSTSR